ncbi:MAG TPA: Ig-like domain-containing protein [Sphingobacteriaceae bacterium]
MVKNGILHYWLTYLTFIYTLAAISGCASVQSPTGGPRDSVSPKIIKETPENLTRNFSSKSIQLEFDELIKLNNETTEISVSPDVERFPNLKIRKSVLDITFQDTLEKNTTYTINFGKAIGDVNENNLLKNYTYVFSTGNTIDSLTLSGSVKSTLSKEKSDITVFILPVSRDSLFGKKKASIFTTTDSSGNFKLEHLKENSYYVYALKEEGQGDRIYNSPNEEIGFLSDTIILNKNISGIELQTFKESPQKLGIKDRKIENDGRISLILNRPAIDPGIKILSPSNAETTKITEFTPTLDTAMIWVPDMTFDSLEVALLDQDISIDTITLRRNKRDSYTHDVSLITNLSANKLRPGSDLIIKASGPVTSVDPAKFILLQDSVRTSGLTVSKVTGTNRDIMVKFPWRTKRNYIINLAEGAITDIYGAKSKPSTINMTLDELENYGNVTLKIKIPDSSSYLVEMLRDEKVIKTEKVPETGKVDFLNFPTGKYRFRIIYDSNKNGKWDTGNVRERRQPELIWEYDKDITLRPNWDIEEAIIVPKAE